jgi:putative ABC transport system permease protein
MQTFGLTSVPVGWHIQTPQPLTPTQIDRAQGIASAAGLSVETRPARANLSQLRTGATVVGIAVALGVLAMTVGLIRAEAARDLRTLTATGARGRTRRTLTGATAAALAVLGSLLCIAGAYLAFIAWHLRDLHWLSHVPLINLTGILVGLPAVASIAGWPLTGREPAAVARSPLD